MSADSVSIGTMVARVSLDDVIIYANDALAKYLNTPKRILIGSSLVEVSRLCNGEISSCFARPETGRSINHLVTDDEGRIFEAQLYSRGGALDIILDEMAAPEGRANELRQSSGTPFESLNEDELRTVRHPERRYLSVTYTQLERLAQFAGRLDPMEVKLIVDSFVEEASEAVRNTGCTVGEATRDAVLGIYGAPRYYAEHPLRAIIAACEQIQKASQLHAGLYREGKEWPPCSCGVWTGDTLVGVFGNSPWRHYTAIGAPVDLAESLCRLARPGEAILPEHTLTHMLRTLPEGWQHIRAESEHEPDLSGIEWSSGEMAPVPEHLRKVVYLVGRGVQEDPDRTELYFDYLWSFRVPGRDQPTPILRVVRPSLVSDSFELSEDNVVTTQATQALGKYKLVEVIGTGGMGTVWRGTDRFGNPLAIKILHSSEAVSKGQLKRFRREAEIMARLPHRNICRVYELNEFDGVQYIAMEYVDGIPLSDLLYGEGSTEDLSTEASSDLRVLIRSVRTGKASQSETAEPSESPPRPKTTRILPVEQTLSLILKVCDAVQFAHEHGVLHRDLKPANILLREDGEPLVADFGLAKLKNAEGSHSLSVSGHVVGTFENMAPEQAESSKEVDERADVYSIGTILYQMLAGRRHFEATGNIVSDGQALKTHAPARLRTFNPQVHPDLEIITLKALRNDPDERYRSVSALRADIDHYRRGEVISAKPLSPVDLLKKLILRNKVVSAGIAGSVLVIVSGALISIYFLNAKLRSANNQYVLAESRLLLANQKEQEAKLAADAARSEQARAESALAEMQRAEEAAKQAQELARQTPETKVEPERREEFEKVSTQSEGKLHEAITTTEKVVPAEPAVQVESKKVDIPPAIADEAQQLVVHASEVFDKLSRDGLRILAKSPEEVVRKLSGAMESVSRALVVQPNFGAAWMLKGRLHWSLMEFEPATESFRQAANLAAAEQSPSGPDSPREVLALAESLPKAGVDRYLKAADILAASSLPQNATAGNILKLLSRKPTLRKSTAGAAGPLRRSFTANEIAVELIRRNGMQTRVFFKGTNSDQIDVIIWGSPELRDLSPLREIDVSGLALVGARTLDWQTIYSLPMERLDFSKCSIESFPQGPRGLPRVRSLKLADSEIASADFARSMPLLESLDLSSTHITDLSPLASCRRLRYLDLAGLNPANMRILMTLPIESLTVSPMLITDKSSLNALRYHRTLNILRAPDDPPAQPASDFWRKLESGKYNQIQ